MTLPFGDRAVSSCENRSDPELEGMEPKPEMPSSCLLEVLQALKDASLSVWLDGGWGVDALLETQTRPHKDVDIIVRVTDVPMLQVLLAQRGFTVREGSPPDSFVLADGFGLEIDVHAVVIDAEGNGVYRMQNGQEWIYPAEGFHGRGVIDGTGVNCLSPKTQVLCHAHGYVPVEKDYRDMELLAQRFGVELPARLLRDRD